MDTEEQVGSASTCCFVRADWYVALLVSMSAAPSFARFSSWIGTAIHISTAVATARRRSTSRNNR